MRGVGSSNLPVPTICLISRLAMDASFVSISQFHHPPAVCRHNPASAPAAGRVECRFVKLDARPWLPPAASLIVRFGFWHWAKTILVPAYTAMSPRNGLWVTIPICIPHWLGARELLLHGQDPMARRSRGRSKPVFTGRPLDPKNPGNPAAREAFWVPTLCRFSFS